MDRNRFRLALLAQLGKLLLKTFAFLLEAALDLCQLRSGQSPRLLSALLHCLFLYDPLLKRADLLGHPAIFLIGLLQLAAHRLEFGFQAKEVLRCFIRRGTVGLLLLAQLRHLLLQRRDLFGGAPVLQVGLLQPTAHRLEFGFQAKEVLRCFIRRGTVGLLLLAQLRHLLLQRRDLFGGAPVLQVGLLQLLSGEGQLITQNALSLTKSTFQFFHHSNSRLESFCSRIYRRPTICHYPKPFTENFYFSDIKVF